MTVCVAVVDCHILQIEESPRDLLSRGVTVDGNADDRHKEESVGETDKTIPAERKGKYIRPTYLSSYLSIAERDESCRRKRREERRHAGRKVRRNRGRQRRDCPLACLKVDGGCFGRVPTFPWSPGTVAHRLALPHAIFTERTPRRA